MEVKKVLVRIDGIKYVILPKVSEFQKGDQVLIIKLNKKNLEFLDNMKGGQDE